MPARVVRVDQLKDALMAEVKATYDPPKLEAMGKFMRDMIRDRTAVGIDSDGKPFKPYSTKPIYISRSARPVPRGGEETPRLMFGHKEDAFWISPKTGKIVQAPKGKKGKGDSIFFKGGYAQYKANVGTPWVNLMCTGRMLGSLFAKVVGQVIIIAFRGDEANDKAVGNDARRNFFGLLKIPSEQQRVQAYWQVLNGQ